MVPVSLVYKKPLVRDGSRPCRSRTQSSVAVSADLSGRFSAAELIKQAYLRTLTRLPTESEVQRCNEFFAEASSPSEGARGVLWALINTKEFLFNH